MIRILTLNWSKIPSSELPKARGRLMRYIATRGGMLSSDDSVFITEDLDVEERYNILKRIFTLNGIEAYERLNVYGFDGAGRVF